MAKLPHNIERVKRTFRTFRYRGYTKDGWTVALCNATGKWRGKVSMTGDSIGPANTLAEMSELLANFEARVISA